MIPEEALEAAAKALFERHYDLSNWAEVDVFIRKVFLVDAAVTLEAAAAILMAQAWEDGKLAQFETELTGQPIRDNPYGGNGA